MSIRIFLKIKKCWMEKEVYLGFNLQHENYLSFIRGPLLHKLWVFNGCFFLFHKLLLTNLLLDGNDQQLLIGYERLIARFTFLFFLVFFFFSFILSIHLLFSFFIFFLLISFLLLELYSYGHSSSTSWLIICNETLDEWQLFGQ